MEAFQAIRGFLQAVRSRLRAVSFTTWGARAAAALLLLLLILPMLAWVLAPGAAMALRVLLLLGVVAVVPAFVVTAIAMPRRRTAGDLAVARWVGRRVPAIASDLVSAVELEREIQAAGGPRFSRELTLAFADGTAERLSKLRPATLVPTGQLRRAVQLFAGSAALLLLTMALAPGPLGNGWQRLLQPPRAGASASAAISVPEPLVGDLNVTLRFPAYTGRAQVTVPTSSGDVIAPRGTEVTIETTALRPAQAAAMVFDGTPEKRLDLQVSGEHLRGSFVLDKPGAYRFILKGAGSRPLIESDTRKLDIEVDRAPRVDLFAPADDLEVSSRKRVELAYATDDDYGIKEIALVWRNPTGREERKLMPFRAGRNAQGKFLWDLTEIALQPGARIGYHLEVKDNDDVGGPNIGTSKTYYLRVYSPRERHSELIERQQQVFERAVALLGDRLEAPAGELPPRRDAYRVAQQLVVEIGQLAGLVDKDPMSPKKLKPDLDAMHTRLEKLAREEQTLLDDLETRAARSPDGALNRAALAMLGDGDRKQVAELEKDVLQLDDWIGRQRLEEMLSIADEIKQRRDRLAKLMEEYQKTGSEKLREEIERDLRALEQLEAELEEKSARLGGELSDRFLNADALRMEGAQGCLQKVRELIAAGDIAGSNAQLKKCSEMLDTASRSLEDGLRDLRGEKFTEEEKAYNELMDEIADLEQQERDIARQAEGIEDRYKQRAAEVAKDRANPYKEKAKKTLDKLREELAQVPKEGLTPFGQDEYDALMRRLDDVGRMIDEGDVAEALEMAKEARTSLQTLLADLDDDMSDGEPWSDKTDESLTHAHKGEPIADQLVDELEKATPRPDEIMDKTDRQKLEELKRRQQALRERTRRAGQKAQKRGKELPQNAAEDAQRGLGEAEQKMQGAEKRMGATDPGGARGEAEGAAEKLGGLRKGLQQSARPTTVGNGSERDDDEVHIPGADEYKPPEEFREKILDAKSKGKAPADYQEQVEQYYKEITQ